MKNSTIAGIALAGIGLLLMYVGLYGWTGAPNLVFPIAVTGSTALTGTTP